MSIEYRQLRQDKFEIRLLEMLPNRDQVSFRMHYFFLDEAPPFWAISYAWGDPREIDYIDVNGLPFQVTRNLKDILIDRHSVFEKFRTEELPNVLSRAFLWVDAVCINQSDLTERTQQIPVMGKIYRTGSIAVCLDHNDWEVDRTALHFIWNWTRSDVKIDPTVETVSAVCQLFTKKWFRRMWTIQEFILSSSNECYIWMSYRPVPALDLWKAAHTIFYWNLERLSLAERISFREGAKQYLTLFDVKAEFATEPNPGLFTALLWIFRDRLSSDPRDKIYSMLALLDGAPTEAAELSTMNHKRPDVDKLIVNYEASVEDVYASLVDAVVSGTGSLNIICASQTPSVFSRSWVPDWTEPWTRHNFLTTNMHGLFKHMKYRERTTYKAAASTAAQITFSDNRKSMHVQGVLCDRICLVADPPAFPPRRPGEAMRWSNHFFETLETDLRERLINNYGGHDRAGTEFMIATVGGLFSPLDIRNFDYRDFYQNASPEWHRFAETHSGKSLEARKNERDFLGDCDVRSHQVGYRRKIFIGERGYCGLIPDCAEIADSLWILFGCDVPVLLRNLGPGKYTFMGEAYGQGLMQGEAIELLERGELLQISIELL